jgi:threonine dehydratase
VKKIDYLERILKARVYDVAIESPLELAPRAVAPPGQPAAAQARGPAGSVLVQAARRLQQDGAACAGEAEKGVITASAGNHAQGVALAAQKLGCRAVIVMPVTTPRIKVEAVLARGAEAVLRGDSYAEALAHAMRPAPPPWLQLRARL